MVYTFHRKESRTAFGTAQPPSSRGMCLRSPLAPPLPGRGGLGVGAAKALGGLPNNYFHDAIDIGLHFAIPKSDHPPAKGLQIFGPSRVISRGFEMLAAVKLNAQPCLAAGQLADIGTDRSEEMRVGKEWDGTGRARG